MQLRTELCAFSIRLSQSTMGHFCAPLKSEAHDTRDCDVQKRTDVRELSPDCLSSGGYHLRALIRVEPVISLDESAGKRVLDAGSKACDLVCGPPLATSIDDPALADALRDVTYASGGDEHGVLRGVPPGVLPLGSTVQLVPSHCDPTVNLYDYMVGVRNGLVEHVWTIDARGY
eukprot:2228158-Pleurochrysis_carterae.AAC.1